MDNKGLSTMQGFIKECYSLLTGTDQKQLWKTQSGTMTLPLESFQNTFHKYTFYFFLQFTACTGERSLFWLSSPLWLPYQLCVLCGMHGPQSNWDSWQSLGGRCCTLSADKIHQFVHGTPHLPRGLKKGPVSSPTTWGLFDPPHPSLPLLIDGCFEK